MTLNWRRSSRCDSGCCVEVALGEGLVHVRDSKNPSGPVLVYAADDFAVLVREAIWQPRPQCVALLGGVDETDHLYAWVGKDAQWHVQVLLFAPDEIREFGQAARRGEWRDLLAEVADRG